MDLKLYNTLGRQLQAFQPSEKNRIKFYSCGPTVYDFVHIGNLRAYIFADTVKRTLEFNGADVDWVMNITDIDDKTIFRTIKQDGATADPQNLRNYTDKYFQLFLNDLKKINIDEQDVSFVKVTEKIADIQLYILELIKKGFAYKAEDGSTYFSIEKYQEKFGDYGSLVGKEFLAGKKIGARVKVDEYEKENLSDFALWKAHGPDDGQIFWDHPELGPGRPGWHIECTLINYFKFPDGTDIHTGGVDLIFPHHTNEIAQALPIYKPFVNYWLHSEHILVDNKKMSKSLGNLFVLSDLEKEGVADGLSLRYLYLQSHYRTPLNVTKQSLAAAKAGLQNLKEQVGKLVAQNGGSTDLTIEPDQKLIEQFKAELNNDLNTAGALSILFQTIDSKMSGAEKLAAILKMDEALGLDLENTFILPTQAVAEHDLPAEIKDLLQARAAAKNKKDFKTADKIRSEIESRGFELIDTPNGTIANKRA